MAKSKSILSIQGTFQNITHVDSRSYGEHIRAARGTHKPAVLNDAMKDEGKKLANAVAPAKLIKDALDPYRQDFYGGQMWQRLVSIFKRQLKQKGTVNYHELTNFEIYKEYPLGRFAIFSLNSQYDKNSSSLTVTLSYPLPVFKKVRYVTHYRLNVIGIFPINEKVLTNITSSEIILCQAQPKETQLTLSVPTEASVALLCVKFEGFKNGELAKGLTTKGMAILKVMNIE